MTFQLQKGSDPRSDVFSDNISEWFSGCIRSRNKNRLLGLLQSGRNPNKVIGNFDVSQALSKEPEKLRKIEPYLKDGYLPSTSVLHEAIIYNDEDVINILLNFGSRINDYCGIDQRGLTCLMLAVVLGHNNLLDLLVKRGCNYSLYNSDLQTALDLAIINGNIGALHFLAPFKRFFYFKNPKRSKLTICEYINSCSQNSSCLDVVDQMVSIGYSLGSDILLVVQRLLDNNLDCVATVPVLRNLINHNQEPGGTSLLKDPVDNNGGKLLHVLSRKCNLSGVQALIDCGSDVNDIDGKGDTPFHIVLRGKEFDLRHLIYIFSIVERITSSSVQVLGLLLQAGADLFKCNNDNLSPLDVALEFSQVHSIIATFVSSQAGVLSSGERIHNMLANGKLNPKVLQFLRSRKVSLSTLNTNNQTPLHVLLEVHGSTAPPDRLMQAVNVLLENETILDIIDSNGLNAAMIALSNNVPPMIVMRLISGPACTQHINPKGQDLLSMIISGYKAKDEEKLSLCQLAVKKGALVNNPSRFGCKSLIAACEEAGLSAQGIPKFLLSKGFQPLREDIERISTWSLSLLESTLDHSNPITIRTQFPNILISTLTTFIPRINDAKSMGVSSLLSITRKLIHDFHIDVNYYEQLHPVHLLIQLNATHNYPVCPLLKELISRKGVDLNVGYDRGTGSPLTHALKVGAYPVADMLIKFMTDFSKTNVQSMHLKFGFSGIVKTLFKKGVRIDSKFFEKAFGEQDMGIIEEMDWLRNYIRNETRQRSEGSYQPSKKLKSEVCGN